MQHNCGSQRTFEKWKKKNSQHFLLRFLLLLLPLIELSKLCCYEWDSIFVHRFFFFFLFFHLKKKMVFRLILSLPNKRPTVFRVRIKLFPNEAECWMLNKYYNKLKCVFSNFIALEKSLIIRKSNCNLISIFVCLWFWEPVMTSKQQQQQINKCDRERTISNYEVYSFMH